MEPIKPPDDKPFEVAFYVRSPVFSVPEGISLARALCSRCPKGATAPVKRNRDKLASTADAAQTALSHRQRQDNQISEEDSRLLDQLMDATWGGMRFVLEGLTSLQPAVSTKGLRASRLLTQLFGSTGLSFLKDTYSSQLASMQAVLQRIKEDKLDKEIDALCGPEFLLQIQGMLPRYQRMVQLMLTRDSEPTANLLTHRNALARAVVAYATAICATVDEEDPASVRKAQQALAPLEGQRTAAGNRRSPGTSTAEPAAAPVPPAAPDTTTAPPSP